MITLLTSPSKWTSVYQPCEYTFRDITNLGSYDITDNITYSAGCVSAGTGISLFFVGQVVAFTISGYVGPVYMSNHYVAEVTHIDGTDAVLDLPEFGASYSTISVQEYNNTPLAVTLKTGNLAAGVAMSDLTTINAVSILGLYTLDVSGYLQDTFSNIPKPPVTGLDRWLYTNYQLNEFSLKYGLYATQEDINSLALGSVLRVGNIESFSGQGSVYSRLMSTFVQNFVI